MFIVTPKDATGPVGLDYVAKTRAEADEEAARLALQLQPPCFVTISAVSTDGTIRMVARLAAVQR